MQSLPEFYIYVHSKPDGIPFYVGKGSKNRAYSFVKNRNSHYKNIVNKYGVKNIIVDVYPCENESHAFEREIEIIAAIKSLGVDLSNMTRGGEGPSGFKHSEESKIKFSMQRKGKKFTDEHRKKISEALRGKKRPEFSEKWREKLRVSSTGKRHSDDIKNKISNSLKGNTFALGLKRGPMSDEQKAKVSASKKGQIPWNKGIRK